MLGPANGSLWWQVDRSAPPHTQRGGSDRVLLDLMTFIGTSYNKQHLACPGVQICPWRNA